MNELSSLEEKHIYMYMVMGGSVVNPLQVRVFTVHVAVPVLE